MTSYGAVIVKKILRASEHSDRRIVCHVLSVFRRPVMLRLSVLKALPIVYNIRHFIS
jgi:hypothetical protein